MPEPFPWARALAIGLGVLRLSPEQFWNMTPREFAAALRGLHGDPAAPLDRAALDALIARFPDRGRSGSSASPGQFVQRSDRAYRTPR
jgi:uncharacterized phage protein (TIGR02216 family)